ncbi:EAL domain-containing protein [Eubacteriales bacterium OttesenSCG-928-M02]|nr:EAL domain-containing protein [Eubacteriales bacterium OttesenSCG-928-M02]
MELERIQDVTDIVGLEYLQRIQDSLGKVTKITTAVLNTEGVPVTGATNLYAFCEMMQASPDGVQMCMRTNGELIRIGKETRQPAIVTCPNSGLKTAAVPIFLGEKFLGSWLIGQIRTEDVDYDLIEQTAVAAGLSVEDAKRNIAMLPIISEVEFHNILEFLSLFMREITHLAEMNYLMGEKNQELNSMMGRLNRSLDTLRAFIDMTDMGVYVTDFLTGELLMANDVYASSIGKTVEEVVGQLCFAQMEMDTFCPFCPRESLLDENGEPGEAIVWENYLEPADSWLRITSRAIRWIDGRLAHMVTYMDITDRKQQEEEVAYLAYYDQRLMIPNAMRLMADLEQNKGKRNHILCFDIQGLRRINDAYGRETGDGLLEAMKRWILDSLSEDMEMYRIDGDEFAVLITDSDNAKAEKTAKMIWDRFDEPFVVGDGQVAQRIFMRVSMGIIPVEEGGEYESYAQLLNDIERMLEAARGTTQPLMYDDSIDEGFERHLRLEISLKDCVLNNMEGFSLHYQPIVCPQTGRWRGIEALCRWESPELGIVSPAIFIPEAEQLGLIDLVGQWVLEHAVMQVKAWGLDTLEGFLLDVNLSPLQLNDQELPQKVERILQRNEYAPEKLNLEITESAEVHFDEHTISSLERLRQLGVTLSLDDFGTGYASFSNLYNLPVAVLKTDRSFVGNIEKDPFLEHTIHIMVEFAHAAGMAVIAEGVETKEQMEILLRNGVDYFQGYYYARPLPAGEMAGKLELFQMRVEE